MPARGPGAASLLHGDQPPVRAAWRSAGSRHTRAALEQRAGAAGGGHRCAYAQELVGHEASLRIGSLAFGMLLAIQASHAGVGTRASNVCPASSRNYVCTSHCSCIGAARAHRCFEAARIAPALQVRALAPDRVDALPLCAMPLGVILLREHLEECGGRFLHHGAQRVRADRNAAVHRPRAQMRGRPPGARAHRHASHSLLGNLSEQMYTSDARAPSKHAECGNEPSEVLQLSSHARGLARRL